MNGMELVREYFPGISDKEADSILWSKTGFPSFVPKGITPENHFRTQLSAYKKLIEEGKKVCDLCNSEATRGSLCESCDNALSLIRT